MNLTRFTRARRPSRERLHTTNVSELLLAHSKSLAALNHSDLSGLGPSLLLQLLRSSQTRPCQPGERLCEEGEKLSGFWVVLDGLLELRSRSGTVIATLGRSSVFGVEESLEEATAPLSLYGGSPDGAQVLFVRCEDVHHLVAQAIPRCAVLGERLQVALAEHPEQFDVLHLTGPRGLNLPALTELLARTIAADFGDRVLLVRKGDHRGVVPRGNSRPGLLQVWMVDERLPFDPSHFDYIFADEDSARLLARHPSAHSLTIQLTRELPSQPEQDNGQDTLVTVLMPMSQKPLRAGLEGAYSPEELLLHQRGCWLHLPHEVLQGSDTEPDELEGQAREELSRWARAVTHRRVGLGLSGGGAWGFYHYVLLEELTRRKVPIDVITGSSIGSVMGAYYSVRGAAGLQLFRERCTEGQVSLIVLLNILTTLPIEHLLEKDLGSVQLDQLPVRLHPVATDITSGKAMAFTRGPVSLAVRASSSAPGLWGPTLLPPRHFVDGGTADNLPALWLPYFGADLTFSCNCYPAQIRRYRQLIPGPIGRFIKGINPMGRWQDLLSSGSQMLHANGGLGARMSTCAYQISPHESSPLRATEFLRPDEFIQQAQRDEALLAKVEEFAAHWEALRSSHSQVRRAEARPAVS
ncbi:patatin-like phospholipase family protein [Archangium lansingense]|uniref:Patatin-like phospholipase family protein n=1 Tax=Archangium lansingense TaxID=2995310 RepID=A0ABT4A4F7_9BACT|nr:patatin-like phospholipase family protein [Archangium lansinium]MCY1076527.1 patatin-like phospholipase family protein [Archangium lansinium]